MIDGTHIDTCNSYRWVVIITRPAVTTESTTATALEGTSNRYLIGTATSTRLHNLEAILEKLELEPDPEPRPIERTPLSVWHARQAGLVCGRRRVHPRLPRGRLRRWKSLKEKRAAWGIA